MARRPRRVQPFVSTTVHLTFPFRVGTLLHHIMEHTAHYVDMSIPLCRLKARQQKLEELLPERIVVQPFSWCWYFATTRTFTHHLQYHHVLHVVVIRRSEAGGQRPAIFLAKM